MQPSSSTSLKKSKLSNETVQNSTTNIKPQKVTLFNYYSGQANQSINYQIEHQNEENVNNNNKRKINEISHWEEFNIPQMSHSRRQLIQDFDSSKDSLVNNIEDHKFEINNQEIETNESEKARKQNENPSQPGKESKRGKKSGKYNLHYINTYLFRSRKRF